jgi:aminoglycoside phosphotransferase (APT) family kinase protein
VIPEPHSETIAVRTDETFDEGKLATYLKGRLPGTDQPLTVRQFGGGAANLTYELSFGGYVYVLRRPPLGPVAPKSHDMGREHRVLARLHEAFPPAPRSFLYCEDPRVIGAPFFVMERRRGIVVRRRLGGAYADHPDAPRRLGEALVDGLAELHGVEFEAIGLAGLGRPGGFVGRQVDGWWGRWQDAKVEDVGDLDRAHAWLGSHLPPEGPPALIHNDYKLDNAMFAADDPGHLVAVFDWDMATLGDPLSDLGGLLAYWSDDDDSPDVRGFSPMPADASGFPGRGELVQRYAATSGRNVEHIDFFHVLALFRLAVILAQIHIRWLRGQTQDQRFAGLDELVKLIAARAIRLTAP